MISPQSILRGIVSTSVLLIWACTSVSSVDGSTDFEAIDVGSDQQEDSVGVDEPDWAGDVPRKPVPIPYDFGETLARIKNNLFGPSAAHQELTDFIPQSITLDDVTPVTSLGFFGDLMQREGRRSVAVGQTIPSERLVSRGKRPLASGNFWPLVGAG